jgi:hypothetical protein
MEDFKKILKEISDNLNNVAYEYGDYSDIGNEIGFVLGKTITKDELKDFLAGLRHGISLSDGTHP